VKPGEDTVTKGTAPGTEVDFEGDEDYFPLTLPSPLDKQLWGRGLG